MTETSLRPTGGIPGGPARARRGAWRPSLAAAAASALVLLAVMAPAAAQVPTGGLGGAIVGNTLCPPLSINPCALFPLLPPADLNLVWNTCNQLPGGCLSLNLPFNPLNSNLPNAPTDALCAPLPVNPCINGTPCAPLPVNNCFATPTLVTASPFHYTQDLTGASVQDGEPFKCPPPQWWPIPKQTVWFRWTPTASGAAKVDAYQRMVTDHADLGSGQHLPITVYKGAEMSRLTKVACNAPWNSDAPAKFVCTAGTVYQIQVASFYGEAPWPAGIVLGGQFDFDINGCDGAAIVDPGTLAAGTACSVGLPRGLLPPSVPKECPANSLPPTPQTLPVLPEAPSANTLLDQILALGGL